MRPPKTVLVVQPEWPATVVSLVHGGSTLDRRWMISPPRDLEGFSTELIESIAVLRRRTGLLPSRLVIAADAAAGDCGVRRADTALLWDQLEIVRDEVAVALQLQPDSSHSVARSVAIGWAHAMHGAGRDLGDQLHIGIGRDVGTLVIDGRLAGPSVAHLQTIPGGALCQCGRRGCLAAYTSDAALTAEEQVLGLDGLRPQDAGLGLDTRRLEAAAHLARRVLRDHCPLATAALHRAASAAALAISGIVNAADLDQIGVHASPEVWAVTEPTVREVFAQHSFAGDRPELRFFRVDPSFEAVAVGAATLFG